MIIINIHWCKAVQTTKIVADIIYMNCKISLFFFLDTVDWAALAQQWIKMKETVVPPAPPPPSINPICSPNDGSGEAPMDMDIKDDDVPPAPPAPTISGSGKARIYDFNNFVINIGDK